MTISAKADDIRAGDLLERTMDLYRDLSVALRKMIDGLQEGSDDTGPKGHQELIRSHQKSLQSVLEIEASLGKRQKASSGGVELDLDAARAEIRARLAQWHTDR